MTRRRDVVEARTFSAWMDRELARLRRIGDSWTRWEPGTHGLDDAPYAQPMRYSAAASGSAGPTSTASSTPA